jgi:protein associated with RNAse G/E
MKAITPKEALSKRRDLIPSKVIESFNELIVEGFDGHKATVYQHKVKQRICSKLSINEDFFKHEWLNIESMFREQGWTIFYKRPDRDESFDIHFIFVANPSIG